MRGIGEGEGFKDESGVPGLRCLQRDGDALGRAGSLVSEVKEDQGQMWHMYLLRWKTLQGEGELGIWGRGRLMGDKQPVLGVDLT